MGMTPQCHLMGDQKCSLGAWGFLSSMVHHLPKKSQGSGKEDWRIETGDGAEKDRTRFTEPLGQKIYCCYRNYEAFTSDSPTLMVQGQS